MIRVNLLPHRAIRRRRQQQQFFIALGVVAVSGIAIWLLVHASLTRAYEEHVSRNQYLQSEIAKLDKQLEEIKKLKELTASMLARKKVVETLQLNRSEVVHLLDELSRQLPDGIYLKAVKQQGIKVNLNGYTQSQARVSTLMRNLDASPYLENSNLVEIKAVPLGTSRANEFTLIVNIERPKQEEEVFSKGSAKASAPPATRK